MKMVTSIRCRLKNRWRDMSIKPREKMKTVASVDEMTDEELLSLVLGTGTKGCEISELARRLRMALDSAWRNPALITDWRAIKACIEKYNEECPAKPVKGLGEAKLLEIAAAFALAHRLQDAWEGDETRMLSMRSAASAVKMFSKVIAKAPEQENFFVLPIDSDFHPICEPIAVTKGGVASVVVHPREVFCEAIRWRAHAVIVAHNHPSGDPTPSERDIRLTEELLAVAKVVRIHILDHLVIAGKEYTSIRSKGELSFA